MENTAPLYTGKNIAFLAAILVVVILALIGIGPYYKTADLNKKLELAGIVNQPLDFSEIGTSTIQVQAGEEPQLKLVYEEPGKLALTRTLSIDSSSVCQAETGDTFPCATMESQYDKLFHRKRMLAEGIMQSDGNVLARRIRVLKPNESNPEKNIGDLVVPWQKAVEFVEQCEVKSIVQKNTLDFYLNLKNGIAVRSVGPAMDEIQIETVIAEPDCGPVPITWE
ncbi:MAG: hypothetical protein HYY10_01055 [Candidatus Liptonbacteria bacterium]|nr:hypothetical protein [Candidatus Liptonbacteria bacterium]